MDTNTSSLAENFGGNPPVIEKPIGAIAEAIHQRIIAEEAKLHAEEKNERELTTKRIALLTEGTDGDVDATELAIDQSRAAQMRCLERIELLAEQLKQANRRAETQRLDEVASTAERARQAGVKILNTTYPKLAKQLATALAELKQHQETIIAANFELTAFKRQTVELADPERFAVHAVNGLPMSVVALFEVVNLPNETPDAIAYWAPRDIGAEVALAMMGYPNARNRKLLVP
jgi:hypothetical protein